MADAAPVRFACDSILHSKAIRRSSDGPFMDHDSSECPPLVGRTSHNNYSSTHTHLMRDASPTFHDHVHEPGRVPVLNSDALHARTFTRRVLDTRTLHGGETNHPCAPRTLDAASPSFTSPPLLIVDACVPRPQHHHLYRDGAPDALDAFTEPRHGVREDLSPNCE